MVSRFHALLSSSFNLSICVAVGCLHIWFGIISGCVPGGISGCGLAFESLQQVEKIVFPIWCVGLVSSVEGGEG